MTDSLKSQYEALPYPQREPEDERRRLLVPELDRFSAINHFLFGGRLEREREFRVLVAGGGTGDALIALAYQLRALGVPADITYVDLSGASAQVARARAAVHGFDRLRFETGSFLEPGRFAAASFDYINCSGVLHHLESPEEGLRALARLLRPLGGIALMLYGALGRTGVYPAQEMLRLVAPDSLAGPERVRLARKLVAALPETNWLARNEEMRQMTQSDAELYDTLLHSRDRAYSVEDIAALAAAAQMRVVSFVPPALYQPAKFVADKELLERLAGLAPLAQAAFTEKLRGNLAKHEFYAVHAGNPVEAPDFRDPGCIPVLEGFPQVPEPTGAQMKVRLSDPQFQGDLTLSAVSARLLRLIDGERTLAVIRRLAQLGEREFEGLWTELYAFMHGHGYIYISHVPLPRLRFKPFPA